MDISYKGIWGYHPLIVSLANTSETERIQDHLSRVSSALRSRPPAHLSDQQLEARRTTLEWLDEYRAAGVFPHNHVRPDARVPVFVDPHGAPCAVGYLLLRSGQHDLVEKIVRTDNLVRVRELERVAGVAAWLDARGLTLEEAALIQPVYGPPIGSPVPVSSSYASTTVGLSIVTAALTSYAAMAEPTGGAPWVDAFVLGTGIAHTYMILGRTDGVEEPAWAAGLNILGLVASIGNERLLRVAIDRGKPFRLPNPSVLVRARSAAYAGSVPFRPTRSAQAESRCARGHQPD